MDTLQPNYIESTFPTQTSPTHHIVDEIRNKIEAAKQEISRIQRNSHYHISPAYTESNNYNHNVNTENSCITNEPKIVDCLNRNKYNYENYNASNMYNPNMEKISKMDTSMNEKGCSELGYVKSDSGSYYNPNNL